MFVARFCTSSKSSAVFAAHICNALLAGFLAGSSPLLAQVGEGWPTYGGDAGGQRYTSASQINKSNIQQLRIAWTFHTDSHVATEPTRVGALETTPILFKDSLYLTSPFDVVYALDPATGAERWRFEPQLDWTHNPGLITSRGVASWSEAHAAPATPGCRDRIFLGTIDARLIALDADSGKLCAGFGDAGAVDLTTGVDYRKGDDYRVTSPPTVVGDVVVVGSGIVDDRRVDMESGLVRGYDARTGKLLWSWEPIPWAKNQKLRTGAGNTWSIIAADLQHGLVYLPTGSSSPDSYGGLRPGDNRDANSIVALDAKTGAKVWAFQLVHHDLWDYDLAAEPLLFNYRGQTPAVAVATKTGMVFVFNRLTGEPLYKISERPVPQSDVAGEVTSPTQPFSELPPLNPLTLDMTKQVGVNAADVDDCRKLMAGLRYEGIFTPPSLRGSIIFPGPVGGVNWGSTAFDPATGILYANTNRAPYWVRLRNPEIDARRNKEQILGLLLLLILAIGYLSWRFGGGRGVGVLTAVLLILVIIAQLNRPAIYTYFRRPPWVATYASHFGREVGLNQGAPYELLREPLSAQKDRPCSPLPWGAVSTLNLNTGRIAWQTPLGTQLPNQHTGTWNVGGPMVTAGGLVFTAASTERYLRAFDSATGEEVWKGTLPVPAQATPMSYMLRGKQFVVIAAGGHPDFGTAPSDSLVAFALP